jgi:hypothetical protein
MLQLQWATLSKQQGLVCTTTDVCIAQVHRFPFVCVSIALAVRRSVVVGVVYNPVLDELFTATQVKAPAVQQGCLTHGPLVN